MSGQEAVLPPTVQTVVGTLRVLADQFPQVRDDLLDTAEALERDWDGLCCPLCEEVTCDTGCPLVEVRRGV